MDGIADASTRDQFLQAHQHKWIFHSGTPCHGEANISSYHGANQRCRDKKATMWIAGHASGGAYFSVCRRVAFVPIMLETRNGKENLFL